MPCLFVYGSLMSGFGLHRRVGLSENSEYIGEAVCDGTLYDLGEYPGVIEGDARVKGELYAVTDSLLSETDRYEGYRPAEPGSSLYTRERKEVEVTNDEVYDRTEAWVYTYNRTVTEDAEVIDSGDWRDAVVGENG